MKARLPITAVLSLLMLAGCRQFTLVDSPFGREFSFNQELIPALRRDTRVEENPLHAAYTDASAVQTRENLHPDGPLAAGGQPEPIQTSVNVDALVVEQLNRGHAEARRGNFEKAKESYRRVVQMQPGHALAHHRLAIIADKQQDFGTAEHHYLLALRNNSNDADLLSDMGYSYFLQGRYRESENALQQALRRQPENSRALNNLGLLYGSAGDYESALAMFRQAGSEVEAQAKIARLLPDGRPHTEALSAAAATSPRPFQPQGAAQPIADRGTLIGADATEAAPGTALSDAPNEITRRIKEEMERARRHSIAQRMSPSSTDMTPSRLHTHDAMPTNPEPHQAVGGAARHELGHATYEDHQSPRIPDNQINRAFAQIDGVYAHQTASPGIGRAARQSTPSTPPYRTPQQHSSPQDSDVRPGLPYSGYAVGAAPQPRPLAPHAEVADAGAVQPWPPTGAHAPQNVAAHPNGLQSPDRRNATRTHLGGPIGAHGGGAGYSTHGTSGGQNDEVLLQPGLSRVSSAARTSSFSAADRAALLAMDGGMFPILSESRAALSENTPPPPSTTAYSAGSAHHQPAQHALQKSYYGVRSGAAAGGEYQHPTNPPVLQPHYPSAAPASAASSGNFGQDINPQRGYEATSIAPHRQFTQHADGYRHYETQVPGHRRDYYGERGGMPPVGNPPSSSAASHFARQAASGSSAAQRYGIGHNDPEQPPPWQ